MAGPKAPSWKQLFDVVERTIGTRVNEFARSENYAILIGLAARARREAELRTERLSRQVLHLANLPAGSDVNRLLGQIGKLEREVRELRNQLDDAEPSPPVRLAARPARSGVAKASTVSTAATPTKRTGRGARKVASHGVVRQSRSPARQDPA
ncbi:MAG: uncharacterized protein JWM12_1462 [Ilumatobacteraceae bacterium]|jgi:hypothetical protein|nr:uncharacterized protein [Ilumatobacteraceae bacterium]